MLFFPWLLPVHGACALFLNNFLLDSAAACQETEGTTFLELADCQGLHVSKMQAVETHFVCLKVQGNWHFEESSFIMFVL